MKRLFALLAGLWLLRPAAAVEVTALTVDWSDRPTAVGCSPSFAWQLRSERPNTLQERCEIEIEPLFGGRRFSVQLTTPRNAGIRPNGEPLAPMTAYRWRVRVTDNHGETSAWSGWQTFRTAPEASQLQAEWIGAIRAEEAHIPHNSRSYTESTTAAHKEAWTRVDTLSRQSILLRRSFTLSREVSDAVAYVCGLGFCEFSVNGQKQGDMEFAPMWSDYDKSVYYNVYDLTGLLKPGENTVGALLGNGFYNVQGGRYRKLRGSFGAPTLLAKIVVRYTDGTTEVIATDRAWRWSLSPVTFNCIYGGEDYDARLEQEGWNRNGFDDSRWHPAVVQEAPKGVLRPQQCQPVKIMERYGIAARRQMSNRSYLDQIRTDNEKRIAEGKKPAKLPKIDEEGETVILDMGQNLAGFPEFTVRGRRGATVKITPAENCDTYGMPSQRETGSPHYYRYTLRGGGDEAWHPRFSYYGYRYLKIEGAVLKGMKNPKRLPVITDIRSCFVCNSAPTAGSFVCSNPIFNDAHRLIGKAVRSNMQSVFTDCPHREKLGWLEQLQFTGPGLLYNLDLRTFWRKIMQDMADAQYPNGKVPTTAPEYLVFDSEALEVFGDSPEWGSAFIVVPMLYRQRYGDDSLIRTHYRRMAAYVDYLGSRAEEGILDFGLGDWYDYGDFRSGFSRNTPVALVATAQYYLDLKLMEQAAAAVENRYDADHYRTLAEEVRRQFNARFFDPAAKQYATGSQTAQALPLCLGMVEPADREAVREHLAADIRAHGNRLTTGEIGHRFLMQYLAENGMNELFYTMHNHREAPGYGYQVLCGATTLTEQWDPRQGASWNHFMFGHIDEWFYASLAGIRYPEDPAGRLRIEPQPVGDLDFVRATHTTNAGEIGVEWRIDGRRKFTLQLTVPCNLTVDLRLPGDRQAQAVGSGTHTFEKQL